MEEWHQKLHNNTSPDDVVICQVFDAWSQVECSTLFRSLEDPWPNYPFRH